MDDNKLSYVHVLALMMSYCTFRFCFCIYQLCVLHASSLQPMTILMQYSHSHPSTNPKGAFIVYGERGDVDFILQTQTKLGASLPFKVRRKLVAISPLEVAIFNLMLPVIHPNC